MRNLLAAVLLLRALSAFAFTVQPEVPVSPAELVPSGSTSGPGLATNGQTYVAVWTDHRTSPSATYASRMRADGTLLDRVGIRVAESSFAAAVIWTGNAFLISYLRSGLDVEAGGTIEVRTLTPEGILGQPIPLFTTETPATQFRMRMATNGESALLVTSDSNGALLDPDGQKRRDMDFGWRFNGTFGVGAAGPTYLVAAPRHNLELKTQIVTANGDLGESEILMDTVRFGVDVASDGNRFLVAWARGNLYAQFLTVDGVKIDAPIKLTDVPGVYGGSHTLTRLIRRGGEYVLVYHTTGVEPSDTLRLGDDGEKRGPLLATPAFLGDIAVANGSGGIFTNHQNGLAVAFFDPGAPTVLRNPTPVSLEGKPQSDVMLARAGGGFVAVWRTDTYLETPELFLSRGPGSTPVLVAADYAALLDVVIESDVIWVVWVTSEERKVYTRRFTQALRPIDPEPVLVTDEGYGVDHAVAAGGGAVVVVRNRQQGGYNSEPVGPHIEAHILHGTPAGVTVTDVGVASVTGYDRVPAIEWNGSSFVIAWANAAGYYEGLRRIATDDRSTGIQPDDRILAVHMTAAGEVLEQAPIQITVSRSLEALAIANGIAVWQTYHSQPLSLLRHTYAARVAASAGVTDLGGEDTFFGAAAPDGGGFILTRAKRIDPTTIGPEILTVDANLTITEAVPLAPVTVNYYYDLVNPYDADVLGGPLRMLGYTRIAGGGYGHRDRVFVRRITETARRRALRITQ